MTSIAELCADDNNKAVVEESSGFIFYQAAFMVTYGILSFLCWFGLISEWVRNKKVVCNNNRYQVLICLATGCFIRVFSFIEVNCVYEEVFRSLKDIFFVMAFVLIVLFWIELQTGMRSMKSIQRLRPYLITVMIIYAIFRALASVADLFWSGGIKNMFMGVTILIYGSIMALGLYYGVSLLSKMKTMQRSDIQARLQKLTRFIVLENVILVIFLLAYVVRVGVFKKKKETDPWMWFYLKLVEKVLEVFAILILCLTMTGGKAKPKEARKPKRYRASSSDPQRRGRTVRQLKKKSDKAVLLTSQNVEPEWVLVKPEDGARFYFFHVDTRKTVWKLPEGAKKMSLSAYKQQEAKKKQDGTDVEVGSINPLNIVVDVPPPPANP